VAQIAKDAISRMMKPISSTTETHIDGSEDPFALFHAWLAEASASELNDPNAMAVATVGPDGIPNVRMVLLKGVDEAGDDQRGFVFYTNFESTKGRELLAVPKAALVFHWKSLQRQVRVRGLVSVVSDAEADAYFKSRPRLSRIGAWASSQSRPLESRFALETSVAKYTAKFAIGDLLRPPHWSGFRITPIEIEFWKNGEFRLHHRLVFRRPDASAPWTTSRLYP
jgi:pyridoxamine 5'-phosphate oxidase